MSDSEDNKNSGAVTPKKKTYREIRFEALYSGRERNRSRSPIRIVSPELEKEQTLQQHTPIRKETIIPIQFPVAENSLKTLQINKFADLDKAVAELAECEVNVNYSFLNDLIDIEESVKSESSLNDETIKDESLFQKNDQSENNSVKPCHVSQQKSDNHSKYVLTQLTRPGIEQKYFTKIRRRWYLLSLTVLNLPEPLSILELNKFILENTSLNGRRRIHIITLKEEHNRIQDFRLLFKGLPQCQIVLDDLLKLKKQNSIYKNIELILSNKKPKKQNKNKMTNIPLSSNPMTEKPIAINPLASTQTPNKESQPASPKVFLPPTLDETYGLSLDYLRSLGITTPLTCKVSVANLDNIVNEETLKNIFQLAGEVKNIDIFQKTGPREAIITYDHPLEVVQAVSMFHNQMLYNMRMVVKMVRNNLETLPKGLKSIGSGLGPGGAPLKGIRTSVELKKIMNTINPKENPPNPPVTNESNNSTNPQNDFANSPQNCTSSLLEALGLVHQGLGALINIIGKLQNQNIPDEVANMLGMKQNTQSEINRNMLNIDQNAPNEEQRQSTCENKNIPSLMSLDVSNFDQNLHVFQNGDMEQNVIPDVIDNKPNVPVLDCTQLNPTVEQAGNIPQNASGIDVDSNEQQYHRQDAVSPEDSPFSTPVRKEPVSDLLLVFNNLPPNVTSHSLNKELRQTVGEVLFGEMTSIGRAIVRFKHAKDAERCIDLFHLSKVDGQVIEVRYF